MKPGEKTKIIVDYLVNNKEAFTSCEINQILSSIGDISNEYGIPYIALQVYDELGFLSDDINPYKKFAELIDLEFNIKDKNVYEIGGGNIPRLAKRISLMQDKGTITVFDDKLYVKDSTNKMKLIKRKFYPITNVDNADVLVGLLPCGANSAIVKSAIRHNKDFMIALCDECNYSESFDCYETNEDWPSNFIDQVSTVVEKNNLGKLKVKYAKEIGVNYPIIYNFRG